MQLWSGQNGCSIVTDTVAVPNNSITDGCTAEIINWRDCDSSKHVVHYRIIGGGHTWPGAPVNIGITNHDFNASGVIWNFFNQYTMATAVHETQRDALKVYPNPFNSKITFVLPPGKCKVELYTSAGNIIISTNAIEKFNFDGGNLKAGYYFAKITTPISVYTIPVIRSK